MVLCVGYVSGWCWLFDGMCWLIGAYVLVMCLVCVCYVLVECWLCIGYVWFRYRLVAS